MDANFLHPNIIKCMKPEDRKALGVMLPEEARDKIDAQSERNLQNQCENYLRLHNIEFLHISHRAREKVGWPDLVWADVTSNGRFCAVELKAERGVVEEDQVKILQHLTQNGARVEVIRSLARFIEFVNEGRH